LASVKEVLFLKAPSPIVVKLFGSARFGIRFPAKALAPIVVIFDPSSKARESIPVL